MFIFVSMNIVYGVILNLPLVLAWMIFWHVSKSVLELDGYMYLLTPQKFALFLLWSLFWDLCCFEYVVWVPRFGSWEICDVPLYIECDWLGIRSWIHPSLASCLGHILLILFARVWMMNSTSLIWGKLSGHNEQNGIELHILRFFPYILIC